MRAYYIEQEMKEIYYAEALNTEHKFKVLFNKFDGDYSNNNIADLIYLLAFKLKNQSLEIGQKDIAMISELIEYLFKEIREKNIIINNDVFHEILLVETLLDDHIHGLKKSWKKHTPPDINSYKTKIEAMLQILSNNKTC